MTEQESDFRRLLEICKQLLDHIIPIKYLSDLTFVDTKPIMRQGRAANYPKIGNKGGIHEKKSSSNDKELESSSTSTNDSPLTISAISYPILSTASQLKQHGFFAELPNDQSSAHSAHELINLLIEAINIKNVNCVTQILAEADKLGALLEMLKSYNKEGQTPLHIALIQLQTGLLLERDLQQLPEGVILIKLLTAHATVNLNITGVHHKNTAGLSPLQLAMQLDETETLARFLLLQDHKAIEEVAKKSDTILNSLNFS